MDITTITDRVSTVFNDAKESQYSLGLLNDASLRKIVQETFEILSTEQQGKDTSDLTTPIVDAAIIRAITKVGRGNS